MTPIAAAMIEEVSREKRKNQHNETTERKRKRDIIIGMVERRAENKMNDGMPHSPCNVQFPIKN